MSNKISILTILAVIWFIILIVLSHTPGDRSAEESGWLSRITGIDEQSLRSAAHVGCFLVLALLVTISANKPLPWLAGVAVWCVLDEVTKIPIPGRHFSWHDSGLNLIGMIVGTALGFAIRYLLYELS